MALRGRIATLLGLALLGGASGFVLLTAPQPLETVAFAEADAANGETVFWASGCASCHAADDAKGAEKLRLGGGHRLETPFGTFVAPNISPDPDDGLGGWSDDDFRQAMKAGIAPDGRHYYPAFPYTSYARMTDGDVADLWAFMKTLPPVSGVAADHELRFPFNIRRGLGLWKRAFLTDRTVVAVGDDPQVLRGQYLVEGMGHCGECHTPRAISGQMDLSAWLAGGPAPEGDGRIPAIHAAALDDWSEADIAYYLESGFTPDFDSVGGSMVSVQENMARLSAGDREAIAAYLKAVQAPR